MTDALVKRNFETLQQKLLQSKQKVAELLQGMVDPNKFIRGVLLAVSKNPKLLQATPSSVYLGAMQAADLGLVISDIRGEAFLVPYRNRRTGALEAQLQTGYKGLLKLAYRTGLIEDIVVELVYEGDTFRYEPSQRENPIHHVVNVNAPRTRDKLVLAYMIAWLKGSSRPHVEVMLKADLDKIRDMALKRSASGESELWTTHYEEACRKTVLRRGLKYLPLTLSPSPIGEMIAETVALEEAALVSGEDVAADFAQTEVLVADEKIAPAEEPSDVVAKAEDVIRRRRGRTKQQADAGDTQTEAVEAHAVETEPSEADNTVSSLFPESKTPMEHASLAKAAAEEFVVAIKTLPDPVYQQVRTGILQALGLSGKSLVEVFSLPDEKLLALREAAKAIQTGTYELSELLKIVSG